MKVCNALALTCAGTRGGRPAGGRAPSRSGGCVAAASRARTAATGCCCADDRPGCAERNPRGHHPRRSDPLHDRPRPGRRRTVELTRGYLSRSTRDGSPAIVHGCAETGHAAQGITLDSAFVFAGDAVYREWMYVALSRARSHPGDHAQRSSVRERSREPAAPGRPGRAQPSANHGARPRAPRPRRELLSRVVGPRPERPSDALRWDRALNAVTAFRHAHQVEGVDDLLGRSHQTTQDD